MYRKGIVMYNLKFVYLMYKIHTYVICFKHIEKMFLKRAVRSGRGPHIKEIA